MTLEQEFEYYLKNQADLIKKHSGRYVVIKGEELIGVFDSKAEAIIETSKAHEMGTFLVQKCSPGSEAHTQTFHSRVVFC